jgi:hypothetical protein
MDYLAVFQVAPVVFGLSACSRGDTGSDRVAWPLGSALGTGDGMVQPTVVTAARFALLRRQRELDPSDLAAGRLTPKQVTNALSQDEDVTTSANLSWKDVQSPAPPQHSRLSAYAQFVATGRSLGGEPSLVAGEKLALAERREREGSVGFRGPLELRPLGEVGNQSSAALYLDGDLGARLGLRAPPVDNLAATDGRAHPEWRYLPQRRDKNPIDKNPIDKNPIDKNPIDKNPIDKNPIDKNPIDKNPDALRVPGVGPRNTTLFLWADDPPRNEQA